jgi:hypothetical protein
MNARLTPLVEGVCHRLKFFGSKRIDAIGAHPARDQTDPATLRRAGLGQNVPNGRSGSEIE